MKGFRRGAHWTLAAALLLALALPGCTNAPHPFASLHRSAEARKATNLRTFDRVWSAVNAYYYDAAFHGVDWRGSARRFRGRAGEAENTDALYAVINEMLAELKDAHTVASTPDQAREFRRRKGVLLGLVLGKVEGSEAEAVVLEVFERSPAAEAGVRPGWILVAANGRPARESLEALRLAAEETVNCDFLDERDQPKRIPLRARLLNLPPIRRSLRLPDGSLYLRMDEFEASSIRWLRRQLKENRGVPALVLDLRANFGGEVEALEQSLGEFFPSAVNIGTFIERGGHQETDHSVRRGAGYDGRLAVLVSQDSASCAEIFAEVMLHTRRAVILGQNTRGSVLGSDVLTLPDGGELQYSVFDYISPRGRRLEGVGVAPDEEVATTLQDLRSGRDRGVEAALSGFLAAGKRGRP